MDYVWVTCPFCVKQLGAFREQINSRDYRFQCSVCGMIWAEPSHTINLNKHGENDYIKPRRI